MSIIGLVRRKDTPATLADPDDSPTHLSVDSIGRLHVTTAGGGGGGTEYAEDAVHASGDLGTMSLGVRKDTAVALAADGDYVPLIVDSTGRLHISPPADPFGVNADAALTAGATGSVSAKLRTLSRDLESVRALLAGVLSVDVATGSVSLITHTTSQFQILPSAARTATPTIADFTNEYAVGVFIIVNCTASAATPIVTPVIKMKADQVSDAYVTVLSPATITGASTVVYYIGPEKPVASDGTTALYTASALTRLWRSWTMTMTHTDADSITYSVEGVYVLG